LVATNNPFVGIEVMPAATMKQGRGDPLRRITPRR
jgi:hypothetical protein